ncbi:MAG TPA: hypothetical protein VGL71_13130, partial [Urbifossiella sp.]
MRAILLAVLLFIIAVVTPAYAFACPFCSGPIRSQSTIRMRFASAKFVAHGILKNPRFDPQTDRGYTDFEFTAILKDDPARGNQKRLTIPQYLPVIGNTPPDYLLFCDVVDGKLDVLPGMSSRPALIDYLKTCSAIDDSDPAKKLGFFFKHLDSADPAVAADAFVEFARASEVEILKAAAQLDAGKIRKLIADPNSPIERLGVYSFLLGVCGTQADADYLGALLKESPMPERTSSAFGGLLAGYIMLAPKEGWPFAAAILAEEKRGYAVRLSALSTVRFFQATRIAECKPEVLRCCAALLPHGDLADQAVEDLRRWGYWDLTRDVLAQYGKPTHGAPLVKRSIVRYALTCPNEEAKV